MVYCVHGLGVQKVVRVGGGGQRTASGLLVSSCTILMAMGCFLCGIGFMYVNVIVLCLVSLACLLVAQS